jgi:hypothetical protein
MLKLFFCPVNCAVVLLLGVKSLLGWVDHWCIDVSCVWRVANRHTAFLLHNNNIRNDELLHRGSQVLHHQGSRVLHRNLCCPDLHHQRSWVLHRGSQVLHHQVTGVLHVCCPSLIHRGSILLHHQSGWLLHRAAQVLHHQGFRLLHHNLCFPSYYTEVPKYYSASSYTTTTEVAKYYEGPTYYTAAASSNYIVPKYHTKAPVYCITTYATPRCYTEVSKYYTEKTEYYTSTYAAPVYYTEEPKYYSAPNYY